MTPKLLKHLSSEDIKQSPVWRFWTEHDIEYAIPESLKEIPQTTDTFYIVHTEFQIKNGFKYQGFCSPGDTSGMDYIQPVIINKNIHVKFWKDKGWTDTEKNEELEKLGFSKKDVFPILYRALIPVDGHIHAGEILDFNISNNKEGDLDDELSRPENFTGSLSANRSLHIQIKLTSSTAAFFKVSHWKVLNKITIIGQLTH